jgi:hypothetical protein
MIRGNKRYQQFARIMMRRRAQVRMERATAKTVDRCVQEVYEGDWIKFQYEADRADREGFSSIL